MHIFVSESGSFINSNHRDAWCIVLAYVNPKLVDRRLKRIVHQFSGESTVGTDTKPQRLDDTQYARFFERLGKLNGIVAAVAVDVGMFSEEVVARHRNMSAEDALEQRAGMLDEDGRQALADISNSIRALSPQSYARLLCYTRLFHDVLKYSISYYAQKKPQAMEDFFWKINGKNIYQTDFEMLLRNVLPPVVQAMARRDPVTKSTDSDCEYLSHFRSARGSVSGNILGIDEIGDSIEHTFDVEKMINDDFTLVDSDAEGVKVADVLADGVRRLLRRDFDDPIKIAASFGINVIKREEASPPIRLIAFENSVSPSEVTISLLREMDRHARTISV